MSNTSDIIDFSSYVPGSEAHVDKGKIIDVNKSLLSIKDNERITHEHVAFINFYPVLSVLWKKYQENVGWPEEYYFIQIEKGPVAVLNQMCIPSNKFNVTFFSIFRLDIISNNQIELIRFLLKDNKAVDLIVNSDKKYISIFSISILCAVSSIDKSVFKELLEMDHQRVIEIILSWYIENYRFICMDRYISFKDYFENLCAHKLSCKAVKSVNNFMSVVIYKDAPSLSVRVILDKLNILMSCFMVEEMTVYLNNDDIKWVQLIGFCVESNFEHCPNIGIEFSNDQSDDALVTIDLKMS
ncbi:hypothetical protein H9C73_15225 [Marinobacterium sp. AK62]|uniref:BTB domain-containing protein n=1 Tax=Marinobacterium alkalitolerans TaxID=1542925 RepID=A0ABS3ZEE1_9GAMM|nr:hypothetical protein [Marinobacterium alkalitolerans]MBP0050078.1 hypothetical protein [Marinobacterium alkalitolerans]